ncbi:MAG: hypothetical protein ACRDE7_05895 [Sphingobacterium sp.]
MLDFLKDITFKANDVVLRAIDLLIRNYISIAGLCLLLFITSNLSSFLAMYFDGINIFLKLVMLFFFMGLYFSLQLILLKNAVSLAKGGKSPGFWGYVPSLTQFLNYIFGLLIYSFIVLLIYCIMYVLLFPLLYLGVSMDSVRFEIHPFLTGLIMLFVLIRTTFFPFFILENDFGTFKSYKFSLAMTKGNVGSLLMIILIIAATHLLQLGTDYMGYSLVSKILSLVNSFLIVPVVSVVMSIMYVDMMKAYKGGSDPSLIKNII